MIPDWLVAELIENTNPDIAEARCSYLPEIIESTLTLMLIFLFSFASSAGKCKIEMK